MTETEFGKERSAAVGGPPAARAIGASSSGVSLRAVVAAFVLVVMVSLVGLFVEIVWGRVERFGAGVPAPAPVIVLFLLAAAGGSPYLRRSGFTRRELLAIHAMVLTGGCLLTAGVLFWMLPKTIAYYYGSRVNPTWELFFPYVPAWFAPTESQAVTGFFEGHMSVPWSDWTAPLAAWLSFMVALFVCTLCLLALLQRQWVTHERLAFPLAQIPLEMVREPADRNAERSGRLTSAPLFWTGVGASFLLNALNTLSLRVSSVPALPLGPLIILQPQQVGPLAGIGEVHLVLWPWLIAIAYLIPTDLSFSAWFFWLVRIAVTIVGIAAGVTPAVGTEDLYGSDFPAPYFQGGGAVFALGLWAFWIARSHLSRIARGLLRPGPLDDTREPVPYRLAVVGLILSFAWLVGFCVVAGCRVWFGVAFMAWIVGYYVVWARLRAEAGIGFIGFPLEIEYAARGLLGMGRFRPAELVTLISARWTTFAGGGETFEVSAGNVLETFKIADAAGIRARALTLALLGVFLFSLVLGTATLMMVFYHYGYFSLAAADRTQAMIDGGRIFYDLVEPGQPDANAAVAMLAGAVVAITLGILRLRFWWWPLHPLGYIAANSWGMKYNCMPFFLGWACKSLVTRYGGLRLYRQTIPLAIGCVVGDLLNRGLWVLIAVATHGRA